MEPSGIIAITVAVIAVAGKILAPLITERYKHSNSEKKEHSKDTVKYRDVIKLIHFNTHVALHSHLFNYAHPESSGQQQVTGFSYADSNDYWIVKGPHGHDEFYKKGVPVKHGDIIRLEHENTGKNLHSHSITAPITQQQEITAFGVDGKGDVNDNWTINLRNDDVWTQRDKIRLIHVNTNATLHSHRASSELTSNQQEITGYLHRDENDFWQAEIIEKSV